MSSASGEIETDDFGAAIDATGGQPEAIAPAPGAAPGVAPGVVAPPKDYPPFHPSDYKDNPIAQGINGVVDTVAKMPEGSATKDNLGESIVYAVEAYSGLSTGNLPPYMHVVMSAGKYTIRVVVEKKRHGGVQHDEPAAGGNDDLAARLAAAGSPNVNTTEKV